MPAASSPIRALGEIALRVDDLDAVARFYEQIVGLEVMQRFDTAVFFRIAPGHGGHTQVLALFDRSGDDGSRPFARPSPDGVAQDRTTLDHLAFEIDLADYESEIDRLRAIGCTVHTADHRWVKWRSIYIEDPEGNIVELVCHDESIES